MPEKESSKSWDRLEASLLSSKPKANNISPPKKNTVNFSKIGFIALAVAIVPAAIAIANIPYRVVRDPVVRSAPILLFPSMISWDWQCSQAVSQIENAESAIDQAKQTADLDTAKNLLASAQKHLDTLPAAGTPANDLWGGGTASCPNRSDLQVRMLKLGSRLNDEQQAQVQFSLLHNALAAVKIQYQQAQTPDLMKFEKGEWLSTLNRLGQLPSTTLAGRQAQREFTLGMKEFQVIDLPQ
ncbi:MAG: hypothetical protein H7Y37_13965 [Anaerolineae bacterium]|nr:hypothetical protein [Gloeobacterales cyanobacterium ES-bin-313]